MANIENTKKVVLLACRVGGFVGVTLADGKINLKDLVTAWDMVKSSEIRRIPEIDFKEIPAELADLSPEEALELKDYVKVELNIPEAHVEAAIEKALDLACQTYVSVKAAIALIEQLKIQLGGIVLPKV